MYVCSAKRKTDNTFIFPSYLTLKNSFKYASSHQNGFALHTFAECATSTATLRGISFLTKRNRNR